MEEIDNVKFIQNGDEEERKTFIEKNTGLVWSIVKRYANRGYESEELFQVGCIGLIKAVDRFDTSYEVAFSTYAVPLITGEIKRFFRDNGILKVSRSLKENGWRISKTKETLQEKFGRSPTIKELMQELSMTREEIVFAMEANHHVQSIDQEYEGTDGKMATMAEYVTGKPGFVGTMDNGDGKDWEKDQLLDKLLIKTLLQKLSDREERLIVMRFFQENTQSEVAKKLGISQVQVSRLEKKILKKMREEALQGLGS